MEWISRSAQRHLAASGYRVWLDGLDSLVSETIASLEVEPIEPIYGGKSGALIKVSRTGQQFVLKLLPEKLAEPQIRAFIALAGRGCPQVYDYDLAAGWLLTEYLSGSPARKTEQIDLPAALALVEEIWSSPLESFSLSSEQLAASWLRTSYEIPAELRGLIAIAQELAAGAKDEQRVHVHGDIGVHNLFLGDNGELAFVDPSGTIGPRSWDLGCLAVWSGAAKSEAMRIAGHLSGLSGVDISEIGRWVIVRTAASALLGFQRQDFTQYQECSAALPALLDEYSQL